MLEHYRQPLLSKKEFYLRILRSVVFSLLLLVTTVGIGAIAFHFTEHYNWLDAALNCVLIMTGVGTVGVVNTSAGKVLTGIYSIISTLVFFAILVIIFTPILHRILHKFHLDLDKNN